MAAALPSARVLPRGAFGASVALHGALAAAFLLPGLWQAPLRPAGLRGVEVSWAAPGGAAEGAEAEPLPVQGPAAPPAVLDASAPEAPEAAPPERLAAALPPPLVPAAQPPPAELAAPTPEPMPTPPMPQADLPPEVARTPPPTPLPPPPAPPPQRAEAPTLPAQRAAPARPARAAPSPSPRVARQGGGPAESAAALASPGPPATPPAAAPAGPDGPVLVTAPRYRRPPTPPAYPPRAVEFGITGTVLVRARVAPDGSTEETRIWRSSGHALLDAAAIAAVRRWAFEPASVDGRRVEAWVEVPVHFRLN